MNRASTVLMLLSLSAINFVKGQNCLPNNLMTTFNSFVQVYPPVRPSLTPLYFGLMVAPSEDSDYLNTTLTAVQLALDTINADSDLLRGYSLHYILTTSQVRTYIHPYTQLVH